MIRTAGLRSEPSQSTLVTIKGETTDQTVNGQLFLTVNVRADAFAVRIASVTVPTKVFIVTVQSEEGRKRVSSPWDVLRQMSEVQHLDHPSSNADGFLYLALRNAEHLGTNDVYALVRQSAVRCEARRGQQTCRTLSCDVRPLHNHLHCTATNDM